MTEDPKFAEMELHDVGRRTFEGTYRGKAVKIWGQHEDGGFRRIKRWWNVHACGQTHVGIKDFHDAEWVARCLIDTEIDGDLWERWRRQRCGEDPPATTSTVVDKKAALREKLMQMTVDRGCSEAEAETARKLLESINSAQSQAGDR